MDTKAKREERRQPGYDRRQREGDTAELVEAFLRWLAPHSKAAAKATKRRPA